MSRKMVSLCLIKGCVEMKTRADVVSMRSPNSLPQRKFRCNANYSRVRFFDPLIAFQLIDKGCCDHSPENVRSNHESVTSCRMLCCRCNDAQRWQPAKITACPQAYPKQAAFNNWIEWQLI